MGPPAGPEDSWGIYNGKLYMNFRTDIKSKFFRNIEAHIRDGDARWISLWGDLRAGPFNTDCLAETWSVHNCVNRPQPINFGPSPSPSPSPFPSPSPSPSPPSGECATTVQDACGQFIGNVNLCVKCCELRSDVVQPACPQMSDVENACQGAAVVV